jgi:cysteine-S-conjugate beta-lyase
MSKSERPQKPDTKIVTAGRRKEWTGPIVNTPVHRASTILYDDVASLRAGPSKNVDGQFFYGRRGTPTQWSLAEALTEMEPGAAGTMLYSSGVAALTSALLAILKPGDHLLMTDNAYDPTRSFCDGFLKDWGVETTYYDPPIGAGIDALLRPNTAAIFMEVPGSLTFEVHDVPAIVAVAQAHGIATVVDNTWATSLFFKPLSHGVDLSIIAATKYIVGHSDAMAGAVTANANYYPALRRVSQQLGQQLGPDDAWLASRGLRTLSVRLHQHQDSALRIAQWLETQNEVAHVLHPALHSHPGHDLWKRDFEGASGLFSIVMRGGDDTAVAARICLASATAGAVLKASLCLFGRKNTELRHLGKPKVP